MLVRLPQDVCVNAYEVNAVHLLTQGVVTVQMINGREFMFGPDRSQSLLELMDQILDAIHEEVDDNDDDWDEDEDDTDDFVPQPVKPKGPVGKNRLKEFLKDKKTDLRIFGRNSGN